MITPFDVQQAEVLSSEAGWNQTQRDWQRLVELAPDGCFGANLNGRLVSTAVALVYEPRLAWIGMVLTTESERGKGHARGLMRKALDYLDQQGVTCVKLDATDLGRPVYAKLGFVDERPVSRWLRPPGPQPLGQISVPASASEPHPSKPPVNDPPDSEPPVSDPPPSKPPDTEPPDSLPPVSDPPPAQPPEPDPPDSLPPVSDPPPSEPGPLVSASARPAPFRFPDTEAFGVDRSALLARLAEEEIYEVEGRGFALARPGRLAYHFGPCVARNEETAQALLSAFLSRHSGQPCILDLADEHEEAVRVATEAGFQPIRRLMRMYRGDPAQVRLASGPLIYAMAGFEYG